MESGRHRLLGLSVVAGITLVYLAFDRRARRKVLRWAKVLWDGDEEGEERRLQFQFVADTVEHWHMQLDSLGTSLSSLEADKSARADVRSRRCKLQKNLAAANAELWKAQDILDGLGNGAAGSSSSALDPEDRLLRRNLVGRLETVMAPIDALAKRFRCLAPLPAKSLAGSEEPGFRGYKVRADGSKTTYFNNDLDDEAKALIGDIRPKRVDNAGVEEAAAGAAGKIAGSSWNVAGTWESRNMTEWGRGRLTELLLEATFELPDDLGTVAVDKVKDLIGDAEVTMMRRKTKWLFDWAFTLEWRIAKLKDVGPCKGTLKYPDVTPDCDGEFEAICEVDRRTPTAARAVIEMFVRSESEGLRPAVSAQIQKFIDEYGER